MKTILFLLLGLMIGGLLGVVVGGGELRYMNKIERRMMSDNVPWVWGIIGAIGGAVVGGGIGAAVIREEALEKKRMEEQAQHQAKERAERERVQQIERSLGLRPWPEAKICKEGRYWVGITKWIDPRNSREYELKTHRNAAGDLVTTVGGYTILHDEKSANKDVVPALHKQTRQLVFHHLVIAYQENDQALVEDVLQQ